MKIFESIRMENSHPFSDKFLPADFHNLGFHDDQCDVETNWIAPPMGGRLCSTNLGASKNRITPISHTIHV